MHHKFLVFLSAGVPSVVWTGSFNFTHNGEASLENAVIIHSREIAEVYYSEWQQIFSLSEPLDWSAQWMEPEYRIGT